jgi:hypothetical protein
VDLVCGRWLIEGKKHTERERARVTKVVEEEQAYRAKTQNLESREQKHDNLKKPHTYCQLPLTKLMCPPCHVICCLPNE